MEEGVEHRGQHRAFEAADAAHDDDDEGGHDHRAADIGIDADQRRHDGTGGARHAGAEPHREQRQLVDRHALERRRLAVLRAGAERPAEPRALEEEPEPDQQHDRNAEGDEPLPRHRDAVHAEERRCPGIERRDVLHQADAENDRGEHLEDEEHADGHDQPTERVFPHRLEQKLLDDQSDDADDDHGRDHGSEEGQLVLGVEPEHDVGAGHVELAVGEVDDPHDAEDENQTHRHQRDEAALHQSVHQRLNDSIHGPSCGSGASQARRMPHHPGGAAGAPGPTGRPLVRRRILQRKSRGCTAPARLCGGPC